MSMTITEKILASHCGKVQVRPGEMITAKIDAVLCNDITTPAAITMLKEKGMDLEAALHLGLETFDGVFTILVSTPDQIGAVKDRLGIKPMLFFEKEDSTVFFGSEQICLTPIVADVYATEMDPGGVQVWSV